METPPRNRLQASTYEIAMSTTQDSPLSVTGSSVGIVALLISCLTIIQALFIYFMAYRDAPAELRRYTSSVSNTIDEKSFRLRPNNVPGPVELEIDAQAYAKGRWVDMLQEYFNAHLELVDELEDIKRKDLRTNSPINWNRVL